MLHVFAYGCMLNCAACSIFIFKNVAIGDFPEILQETFSEIVSWQIGRHQIHP